MFIEKFSLNHLNVPPARLILGALHGLRVITNIISSATNRDRKLQPSVQGCCGLKLRLQLDCSCTRGVFTTSGCKALPAKAETGQSHCWHCKKKKRGLGTRGTPLQVEAPAGIISDSCWQRSVRAFFCLYWERGTKKGQSWDNCYSKGPFLMRHAWTQEKFPNSWRRAF